MAGRGAGREDGRLARSPLARSWWDLDAVRLVPCGLAILFWLLVLIRWRGATLRIVAHFSNLVLISAFFGLGPGVLLRRLRTPL